MDSGARAAALLCQHLNWPDPRKDRLADSKEISVDNPEKVADGMSALKIKQIEDEVASSYLLVEIGAGHGRSGTGIQALLSEWA